MLVDIYAAGLNFFDILQAQGKYQSASRRAERRPAAPRASAAPSPAAAAAFPSRPPHSRPDQPPMPFTLGAEVAGIIAADSPVPAGCRFRPGDRVCGVVQGAFAERCAVDPKRLLPVPANVSLEQACGIYLTHPTSYEGLVGRANAQPGEWVLVHAAAGGVGLAACEIAKREWPRGVQRSARQPGRDSAHAVSWRTALTLVRAAHSSLCARHGLRA